MYNSIFDPKTRVTVIKETGTYPHKDNCLHVKVSCPGQADESTDFEIHHLSKAEYELAMYMRSFSRILKKEEYLKLQELIEKFGDHRYQEASDNAAMEAAENDM